LYIRPQGQEKRRVAPSIFIREVLRYLLYVYSTVIALGERSGAVR
jgi:hypothetical protein